MKDLLFTRQLILLLWMCHRVCPHEDTIQNQQSSNRITQKRPVKEVLAQTKGNALLPCKFTGPGIVTWIKRKDHNEGQLLTVGRSTHSIDTRFLVIPSNSEWNLQIKNVKHEDAGLYECQIQTEPVQQRFILLNVTDAYAFIPGAPDLHVREGSSLRLECQLMYATERPVYVFWYRNARMINYDDEPGVKVEATNNGSVLHVRKLKPHHGGSYECSPNNAKSANITIHVIIEEEKPAAMHGTAGRSTSGPTSVMLCFITLLGVDRTWRYSLSSSRIT